VLELSSCTTHATVSCAIVSIGAWAPATSQVYASLPEADALQLQAAGVGRGIVARCGRQSGARTRRTPNGHQRERPSHHPDRHRRRLPGGVRTRRLPPGDAIFGDSDGVIARDEAAAIAAATERQDATQEAIRANVRRDFPNDPGIHRIRRSNRTIRGSSVDGIRCGTV
jgi:hypothetical protein